MLSVFKLSEKQFLYYFYSQRTLCLLSTLCLLPNQKEQSQRSRILSLFLLLVAMFTPMPKLKI